MSSIDLDQLYNELGGLIVRNLDGRRDKSLLYVEAQPGVIGLSLFEDCNDHVMYRFNIKDFGEKIRDIWYSQEESKRWAEMLFTVQGMQFSIKLIYADQIDLKEDEDDRRDRYVNEIFGDKPIVYPEWPDVDVGSS